MIGYKLTFAALLVALAGLNLVGPGAEPEDGTLGGNPQSATRWNEFDVEGFPPSQAEVACQLAASVPEAEKATCEARLRRALHPNLCPPDLREHLLPLTSWDGKNVFLTRCRLGDYWVQVAEGGAQLTVEIQRADGGAPVPPGADASDFVTDLANQILTPGMRPKEFHRVVGRPPDCATWLTYDCGEPHSSGFVIYAVHASVDTQRIHYRLLEMVKTSPIFPGVPPYTFAPPPPPPPPPPEAPWPEPIPYELHGFPGSVPLEGQVN